jgi:hypothetical protein
MNGCVLPFSLTSFVDSRYSTNSRVIRVGGDWWPRSALKPWGIQAIVLLSLNPYTELPSNYQNFHSTEPKHRNDQFRDFVEEVYVQGSYSPDNN